MRYFSVFAFSLADSGRKGRGVVGIEVILVLCHVSQGMFQFNELLTLKDTKHVIDVVTGVSVTEQLLPKIGNLKIPIFDFGTLTCSWGRLFTHVVFFHDPGL